MPPFSKRNGRTGAKADAINLVGTKGPRVLFARISFLSGGEACLPWWGGGAQCWGRTAIHSPCSCESTNKHEKRVRHPFPLPRFQEHWTRSIGSLRRVRQLLHILPKVAHREN